MKMLCYNAASGFPVMGCLPLFSRANREVTADAARPTASWQVPLNLQPSRQ
jgi:hypothetical protein